MSDKKKVPLGKPLKLNSKQLDKLSQVTEEDIEKAKQLWRKYAPPEFADLLDAEATEEGE